MRKVLRVCWALITLPWGILRVWGSVCDSIKTGARSWRL